MGRGGGDIREIGGKLGECGIVEVVEESILKKRVVICVKRCWWRI